ncbi:Kae1-associated serine/threonine protein kinase [Candidatus Woesearchaeota archaeon]|nr:Kae1-associated serine/threonine protein kinase [Candidatus Woesearchaeota archaeon]
MQLISQGAEAKIFLLKGSVLKDRFPKTYRIREIDEKLRKSRTRREAKVLEKLSAIGFPAPRLFSSDDKSQIQMEEIKGPKVRDILEKSRYKLLCIEIGEKIAALHNKGIIHGDLTTSNMIFCSRENKIYFIDFGLSFFSEKVEDKAVDLHLLKEALESRHYRVWEGCCKAALEGYRHKAKDAGKVIERIKIVEKRGRYKGK